MKQSAIFLSMISLFFTAISFAAEPVRQSKSFGRVISEQEEVRHIAKGADSQQGTAERSSSYNVTQNQGSNNPERQQKSRQPALNKTPQAYTSQIIVSSSNIYLEYDDDSDGYYNRLAIELALAAVTGDRNLQATLYINDSHNWTALYTGNPFTISRRDELYRYEIETALSSGYSAGYYELMIELYDSDSGELVYIIDSETDADFASVGLESADYEADRIFDYEVFSIDSILYDDYDYDGFYSYYQITLDIDTTFTYANLNADIYLRNRSRGEDWVYEYTTDDFVIRGLSSRDKITISGDLLSGYPSGYYDVLIEIFDADTGELVLSVGPENHTLSGLELEDQERDGYDDSVAVYTDISGAGSVQWWLIYFLLGLSVINRIRLTCYPKKQSLFQ